MKKPIFCFMLFLTMLLPACGQADTSPDRQSETSLPSVSAEDRLPAPTDGPAAAYSVPEAWQELNASFARDDSSQYNNAVLNLKYLGDAFALFEFRLMEGSEDEDSAFDTIISGVMRVSEDGSAVYETSDDAENPLTIRLTLTSTDGSLSADVTHSEDFVISPDGHYDFIEAYIEVSDAASIAILEHLPTAATSLNHNNGEYTINFPDALVSDWFYSVEAVFNDSGVTLAKFLIAKDLSAVFRADDDMTPILIYGTAQPMMDAYVMDVQYEEDNAAKPDGDEALGEPNYEPRRLVEVMLPGGVFMRTGAAHIPQAVIPCDLPYTLTAVSEDDSIATVDENGVVTAVAQGEVVIDCVITCGDGIANIGLVINVTDDLEIEDYNE